MNAVALTRETLEFAHTLIELRVDMADAATFFALQAGSGVQSAAAIYAHTVVGEDHFVSGRMAVPLLYGSGGWRERLGFEPSAELRPGWAATLTCELDLLRSYADAVYARSDSFLAGMDEAKANSLITNWQVIRENGTVRYVERKMPLLFGLMDNVTLHTCEHSGEIAIVTNLAGQR